MRLWTHVRTVGVVERLDSLSEQAPNRFLILAVTKLICASKSEVGQSQISV